MISHWLPKDCKGKTRNYYLRMLKTFPTRLDFRNIGIYDSYNHSTQNTSHTSTLILSNHFQNIFALSLPNAFLEKSPALRCIKWREDTSNYSGLGNANYCNSTSITGCILRAVSDQQVPPHRSYRKVKAPFLLNAPSSFCKSKTLCLLAFVLTGIEMKGCITLRGNSEVQVQSKGGEMKTAEVLQTGWLADQWE